MKIKREKSIRELKSKYIKSNMGWKKRNTIDSFLLAEVFGLERLLSGCLALNPSGMGDDDL